MAIVKRTFGYDEYKKQILEGVEEIGFKRYMDNTIPEHEDTTTTASVDDLGEGESVNAETPTKGEETPPVEDTTVEEKPESETLAAPIDTGNGEDISLDEVKVKMDYINGYNKNLSSLVANSDKVKLDKATKDKVVKLYNIIQGIS